MKTPMKTCEWCEKIMKNSNYKKHSMVCFYRHELKITKSQLNFLKENAVENPEEDLLQLNLTDLKLFLTEIFHKSKTLYKKIEEEKWDPVEKIKELQVGPETKAAYVREWLLYTKFIKEKKLGVSKETANTYLASVKCKPSTLRKKQYMLQLILQHLLETTVNLNKIRKRINFKPKYALTQDEIKKYLEEQKELNEEDYLIQKILLIYGLRINTIGLLKFQHLEFLYTDGEPVIHLPDSKTKTQRVEPIEKNLIENFRIFIDNENVDDEDPDDYVFLKNNFNYPEKRRAQLLCKRINDRILNSKVLKKNPNYVYSSHMFRKTKAYRMYHKEEEELKNRVRRGIGQAEGSQAIGHYI
jgi:integrase